MRLPCKHAGAVGPAPKLQASACAGVCFDHERHQQSRPHSAGALRSIAKSSSTTPLPSPSSSALPTQAHAQLAVYASWTPLRALFSVHATHVMSSTVFGINMLRAESATSSMSSSLRYSHIFSRPPHPNHRSCGSPPPLPPSLPPSSTTPAAKAGNVSLSRRGVHLPASHRTAALGPAVNRPGVFTLE